MNRWVATGLLLLVILAACTGSSPSRVVQLDTNQQLRLAASNDVETLDPSVMSQPGVEVSLARNLFNGLYRYGDDLKVVPDLATEAPEVSGDGLTWTFRIRSSAKFWNGDPVRAADVVFSWNRAAARHNANSTVFDTVAGFAQVQSGTMAALAGLSAPDQHTLVAKLSQPAGWWLQELALWPAWVLDERIVRALGDENWWKTPEGLVGTGPFRLHARSPGVSLDFVPVPKWWGGGTGALKGVLVRVVPDPLQQVTEYERGQFDILGYLPTSTASTIPPDTIQRYGRDRSLSRQLLQRPWLKTTFLTFNVRSGALAGELGKAARRALSLAIDREKSAQVTCDGGSTCQAAHGGIIVKGLSGYLGDGNESNARFDRAGAMQAYRSWDPDGSRRATIRMIALQKDITAAEVLRRQWQEGLGITVKLDLLDRESFRTAQLTGQYEIILEGFLADYDSPHDWYWNRFVGGTNYSNPRFESVLAAADVKLPDSARPDYQLAGQLLVEDIAYTSLDYVKGSLIVKPHVSGAGGNALYEYYWQSLAILQH